MFFKMFNQNQTQDKSNDAAPKEEDLQTLEAFCGDPAIIIAAQELNQLREAVN